MEREIKFRGQTRIKNQWVYGSLIDYSPRSKMDIHHCTEEGCWFVGVLPETVGQYTGLKDKNGKEIYEGDIITYKDYSNGAVLYFGGEDKQPRRTTVIKLDNIITGFKAYGMADFDIRFIEVIGNIHSNPELLQ